MKESKKKTLEFIEDIWRWIDYWEDVGQSKRRCLSGLAHSILVLMDGMSGTANLDRNDIDPDIVLHDIFYNGRDEK